MSQRSLEEYGGYRKARELFDLVVADMNLVRREPLCFKLVSQQVGSADSICANIEEGHGRLSYLRMTSWLGDNVVRDRAALADKIIGILTATIERLRTNTATIREEESDYGQ